MNGRPPRPGGIPDSAAELLRISAQLDVQNNRPKPIVQGRHLIELGHKPGAWFGDVIEQCFEAQLDGEFESVDDGVQYLQRLLSAGTSNS